MNWIIPFNVAALFGLAAVQAPRRHKRKDEDVRPLCVDPPTVYSNLPQVDKVDIHALFRKWEV